MAGRLPDMILNPENRGLQAADLPIRLRNTLEEVQQAKEEIEKSPICREFLNLSQMGQLIGTIKKDLTIQTVERILFFLLPGIQAGLFIRQCEGENLVNRTTVCAHPSEDTSTCILSAQPAEA